MLIICYTLKQANFKSRFQPTFILEDVIAIRTVLFLTENAKRSVEIKVNF